VVIAVADLRTDLGVLHRILLPGSPSRHTADRAVPLLIHGFIILDGSQKGQRGFRDFFRDSGFPVTPGKSHGRRGIVFGKDGMAPMAFTLCSYAFDDFRRIDLAFPPSIAPPATASISHCRNQHHQ
jgi:hypothetical protein